MGSEGGYELPKRMSKLRKDLEKRGKAILPVEESSWTDGVEDEEQNILFTCPVIVILRTNGCLIDLLAPKTAFAWIYSQSVLKLYREVHLRHSEDAVSQHGPKRAVTASNRNLE